MDDVRLIDANALLEEIEEEIEAEDEFTDEDKYVIIGLKIAYKAIKRQPTIEAERGKWITHFDDLFPEDSTIECSVCHRHSPADMQHDNFCPNCGADMRGDNNV